MIYGIFGRIGMGKSTLFKAIVRNYKRAIVIDPRGEHAELGVVPSSLDSFREFWNAHHNDEKWKIVLQPEVLARGDDVDDEESDPEQVLAPYIKLLTKHGRNYLVAIDEVDEFIDAQRNNKAIKRLISYGRHWGIDVVAIARRTQEVPRKLTAQCGHLFVLNMQEPDDIKYIKRFLPKTKEFDPFETLPKLVKFQSIHYKVSDGSLSIMTVLPVDEEV